MAKYILKKLIHSFFTVLGVMIITFVLFNVVAGDPSAAYVDSKSSAEDRQRWKKNNKVDLPAIINIDSRLQFIDNTTGDKDLLITSKNGLKLSEYGGFLTIYKNDKELPPGERILDKTSIQSKRMSRSCGFLPANEETLLSEFLPKKSGNNARESARLINPTPLQLKNSKATIESFVKAKVDARYRDAYTKELTSKFSECSAASSWFGNIELNKLAAAKIKFTRESLFKKYKAEGLTDLEAQYKASQEYRNELIHTKNEIVDTRMTKSANEAAGVRAQAADKKKKAKEQLEKKAEAFANIAKAKALSIALKNGADKKGAEAYAKKAFEVAKEKFLEADKIAEKEAATKGQKTAILKKLELTLQYESILKTIASKLEKYRLDQISKIGAKKELTKAQRFEVEKNTCIYKYKLVQEALKKAPKVDADAEYYRLLAQSKTKPRVPLAVLVARRCANSSWLKKQDQRKKLLGEGWKIINTKKVAEAKFATLKANEIAEINKKYPLIKNPKTAEERNKNAQFITCREDSYELLDYKIKALVEAEFEKAFKTAKEIDSQAKLFEVLAIAEATATIEAQEERKKQIVRFNEKRNLPGLEIKLQDGSDFFVPVTGNETWGCLIKSINEHPKNAGKLTAQISKFEIANLKYCQFYYHMKNCITFQGRSFQFKKTLQQIIGERAKYSLSLTVPSLALGWIIALSLSSIVAYYRGRWIDHTIVFICVIGMCIPFLAYMILGQNLMFKIAPDHAFGTDDPINVYIPICIGMIAGLGRSVRFYRTVILNEVNQDYVRTARAKGVALPGILFKHVLKNCMLPVITSVVMSIPFLIMGNLLLEKFFGISGLGDLMLLSISSRDVPIITAMTFLTAIVYVVGLLVTDILYAVFDPRIRLR